MGLVLQATYCEERFKKGLPHQPDTPEIVGRYHALKAQGYEALDDVLALQNPES